MSGSTVRSGWERLQKRFGEIAATLERAYLKTPVAERAIWVEDGPQPTLFARGVHLTSSCDRIGEASLQASQVPTSATEATVYGLGLGELPTLLLARPEIRRLRVVILAEDVAFCALRDAPHAWIDDRRATVVLASSSKVGAPLRRPFAASPASIRLASLGAARVRDELVLALTEPHQRRRFDELINLTKDRFSEHGASLLADGDVRSFRGAWKHKRCVVVGGGPTLDDALADGWLHEAAAAPSETILIAASTALKPLLSAGLIPSFVVAVDPEETIAAHLADADRCDETTFVYTPIVSPNAVSAWPGPRAVAYLDRPVYRLLRQQVDKGTLFCSGTVVHAAVDLAVQGGAAEVVLVGTDFSYPGGLSHARDAVQHEVIDATSRGCLLVESGNGQPVASEPHLLGYLRDLERYIASHAGPRFINASRRGASIAGTTYREERSLERTNAA